MAFIANSVPSSRAKNLPDQDGVDVVISGLVSVNADTRSDVGEQAESPPQSQVQRNVTLSDGSSQGSLQSDGVLLDGVDGIGRDGGLSVDKSRGNVNLLPLNGSLSSGEDVLDRLGDLGTDTISGDKSDGVVSLFV
jgi:hypothetical protein